MIEKATTPADDDHEKSECEPPPEALIIDGPGSVLLELVGPQLAELAAAKRRKDLVEEKELLLDALFEAQSPDADAFQADQAMEELVAFIDRLIAAASGAAPEPSVE